MSNAYIVESFALSSFNSTMYNTLDLLKSKNSIIKKINKNDIFGGDYPIPYAGFFEELPFQNEYSFFNSRPVSLLRKLIENLSYKIDFRSTKIDHVIALFSPYGLAELGSFINFKGYNKNLDFYYNLAPEVIIQQTLGSYGAQINTSDIAIIDNTCTSGNSVLGIAYQGVKLDVWKNCLVLAIDPVDLYSMCLLKSLGALSLNQSIAENASRPFDKNRDGFVKSDGAAIALVSCSKIHKNDAEILSFSQTADAYKLTEGADDASAIKSAIKIAMQEAGVRIEDIAFIKAHGTATKLNDQHEAKAIQDLFYKNNYRIPVTSLKGHLGHTTDASGLVETILAAEMLKQKVVPFTLNCDDPEYDLDIVTDLRVEKNKNLFISNTSGFGGNNSSLVIKI